MRLYRAELSGVASRLWINSGDLETSRQGWLQDLDRWTLILLEHEGALSIDRRVYPFAAGSAALVAPGVKAGFLRVGPDTPHISLTFSLLPGPFVVGLPALADLADRWEVRRREARDALDWLSRTGERAVAFIHNVLWDLALPPESLRSSGALQEFEALVTERLQERLSVAFLARQAGVSPSQLLRLVRAEYGVTIQEFVRDRRVEIARSLIVSTDLPLKVVALRVGMPDLQYLNKTIRAASGLSPRALRSLTQGASAPPRYGLPDAGTATTRS